MFLRFNRLQRADTIRRIAVFLTGIILLSLLPVNIAMAEQTETPKLVMVLGSDSNISGLAEAYKNLLEQGYNFQLKLFSSTGLSSTDTVEQIKNEGADANVFFMQMVGNSNLTTLNSVIGEVYSANKAVILSTQSIPLENVDDSKDAYLSQYITNGTMENLRRLELYLLKEYGYVNVSEDCSPLQVPGIFIYHPDAAVPDDAGPVTDGDEQPGTVADIIYDAVYNTAYEPEYHIVDNPGYSIVSNTVYDTVYEFGNETVDETVNDTVYDSVYDNVYNNDGDQPTLDNTEPVVEDSGPGLFPGTFNSIDDYLTWYQETGRLKQGAPWIGIIATDSFFKNNDIDMYVKLLESLESKEANVILVFTNSANKKAAVEQTFMKADGSSRINFLVAAIGFNYIYADSKAGIDLFKRLNVPVMAPVYSSNLDDWENNPAGISSEVAWQIAYPELDGRIEPVLMGGNETVSVDVYTGALIKKNIALPDRIERVAGRVLSWANLRNKPNSDKKIALIYYNPDGGKDGIGASYLNVTHSVYQVLNALQNENYLVEGDITAESLGKTMFEKGRNIGSWASGELDSLVNAGAMTIPVDKYLEWYQTLPQTLRDQVEKEWGPAPGNIMVHDGEIVIPGAVLGNIFIGPQPMRGWADDPSKIAHSPSLPPPHQYIAFYLWLQNEYGADAVIHMGTHGTLEWLPGRSAGLGGNDWPDVLIGNMPDIYPYIVNNPGEATQAKRRGYAVTIGHMTPPLIKPELYGDMAELQKLITDYQSELSNETSSREEAIKQEITEKIKGASLEQILNINLNEDDFTQVITKVEKYLEDLTTELMPYGLHTFGVAPEGDLLDQMTDSIVDYDKAAREGNWDEIRSNLALSTNEMTNLLRALGGEYIEPGLGRDPLRVPDVMPTGRNMVSFDPRMVPDKIAWETGKKLADQLLEQYKAENGSYPDSVGVVLWAVETMRTQGESVAMILRLIGAEPVWDSSGKVTKVKVTPVAELGRPRIDVVVTISGLFRDTFANSITLLDDAFRQIALLDESPDDNLVRKHTQEIKETLMAGGMSEEEADSLAAARIFGDAPGTYGTGVSEMAKATSGWKTQQDLTDVYMSRMSYVYGRNDYGKPAAETFQQLLKTVDSVALVRDTVWGTLDNDDVYQYLGGLKLAAEAASGQEVEAYIANTRNAANPTVQTFDQFVATELTTRILNPEWIDGMLKEGVSGSAEIADQISNLFGVASTLGGVDDWAWQKVAETLVLDESVRSQLDPYALQDLIGWSMEAARRDMWDADPDTLSELADTYIQNAVNYGVVCCHHTCKNIVLDEWLAQFSTLDDNVLTQFQDTLTEATQATVNIPMQNNSNETSISQNSSDHISTSLNNSSSTNQNNSSGSIQNQPVAGPTASGQPQSPLAANTNNAAAPGRGAGTGDALPQVGAQTAWAATAGNMPAPSNEQATQSTEEAGKQGGTSGQKGKSQKNSAYEISLQGSGQRGGGVTMWAILSVFGVMLVVALGIAKGKRQSC